MFKLKLIEQELKKENKPKYKTDSCNMMKNLRMKRSYSEFQETSYSYGLLSGRNLYQNNDKLNMPNLLKFRKISSVKKVYESTLTFYDDNQNKFFFKVYADDDIGFDSKYDDALIVMDIDNDTNTDEEQLEIGIDRTIENLRDTINNFKKRKLHNKMRIKKITKNCKKF
jgi:hypothetical protein